MTTEKYLNQLYRLNNLINSYNYELQELQELASSISSIDTTKEKVSGGNFSNDKIEDLLDKISNLEKDIKKEITKFIDLKKEIRDVINQIDDIEEKLYLRYRYIQFYQWKTIMTNMKCSSSKLNDIRESAISNVEKILRVNRSDSK